MQEPNEHRNESWIAVLLTADRWYEKLLRSRNSDLVKVEEHKIVDINNELNASEHQHEGKLARI